MDEAGFTGTQAGMTYEQRRTLKRLLRSVQTLHLGDCIGADKEAHDLAVEQGIWTIGHPPDVGRKRAYCKYDETWPERPYHERNQDIVTCGEFLIACPGGDNEVQRSGTWSTVRKARKAMRPVALIMPKGTIRKERWD